MAVTTDITRRDRILSGLYQTEGKTSRELGEPTSYLIARSHEGWIVRAGVRKGGKGRPSNVWKLTDKGRKRASSLAKKGARA